MACYYHHDKRQLFLNFDLPPKFIFLGFESALKASVTPRIGSGGP